MAIDKDSLKVVNNEDESRFEVQVNGETAVVEYMLTGKNITFTHTEVPKSLEGEGIGSLLAKTALSHARHNNLKVIPVCPFITGYLRRHPEYQSLVFGHKG